MNRAVVAALAAALLLPATAPAQMAAPRNQPIWGPRVRITPFVGVAPSATRHERWAVDFGSDNTIEGRYDVHLGAGPAFGLSVEVLAVDRFAFIGGGALISRGEATEFSVRDGSVIGYSGSNFLLAKAGVAMRLRESVSEMQLRSLSATIFAAPTYVREIPKDDPALDPAFRDAMNAWGLNFGINGQIPLGWNGVAVQAGAEDTMVFWNDGELARRNDAAFAADNIVAQSSVSTDATHMIVLRAGLSIQLR